MNHRSDKGVALLVISCKLKESIRIYDHLLIIRDGDDVSIENVSEINEADMTRLMVAPELYQIFPPKFQLLHERVPEISNLRIALHDKGVSFHLGKGKFHGFDGLVDAGYTEVAETLTGVCKPA